MSLMITVETNLKSLEREIAALAMNPYDSDELNAFKTGAIVCIQWLIQGTMKPSDYVDMYKEGIDDRSGKLN